MTKGVFKIRLKGTEILMKLLKEEGVGTIFGFPGGAVLDIYDELAKTDIRHILVRHEQGYDRACQTPAHRYRRKHAAGFSPKP